MKFALWIGLAAGMLATFTSRAQNENDLLRYSWIDPLASARVTAMGGSFGALGADLSCAGINPAGLGMYRRGDVALTAGFHGSATRAQWNNRVQDTPSIAGTLSNMGIALTYPSVNADWPFFTLAFSHQNRMPFIQTLDIEGVTTEESVSDVFVQQAVDDAAEWGWDVTDADLAAGTIFPYSASLAWRTELLLPDFGDLPYTSAAQGKMQVDRRIEREGRMAETQISFGSAFQDLLYFGATLGLPKVSFEERSLHQEAPVQVDTLSQWQYDERLIVEGKGVLIRVGAMARLGNFIRIGAAHQSRSRLTLLDTYSADIRTQWTDGTTQEALSPVLNYEYLIYTPSRTTYSASFLLGKSGVLNGDYVRTDLRKGELAACDQCLSDGYSFGVENDTIQTAFQTMHAGRAGLELRLGADKQYRLRAGGGMATSPFRSGSVQANAKRFHASVGGGFRMGNLHLSIAWKTAWHSEDYYFMGVLSDASPGLLERQTNTLLLSAGLRI